MKTTTATEIGHRRGPGRPRGIGIESRVLAATVALLLETRPGTVLTISAIVERSGVSRAALYRRWSSREDLIVSALDSVRSDLVVADTGDPLADIIAAYTLDLAAVPDGFERLLRTRLILALEDPRIQRAYWQAHVSRRRVPVAAALRRGVAQGIVRSDLDTDAVLDLISGVHYYQLVVRGDSIAHPETQRRVHEAIRVVWRGVLAESE